MAPAPNGVATGLTLDLVFVDDSKAAVGGSARCWPTIQSWRNACCRGLGFAPISATLRMYRGAQPQVSLADVYGLACLELGCILDGSH